MTRHPDVGYAWNDDVALAYQIVGDQPRDLLVLHGYVGNIEWMWRVAPAAAFLEHLAATSRLILMDRRGTGLSDRFAADQAPSLEDTVDDILAVLDAAGSVRAHVLALWDSSLPAMLLAATHSARVASLTLYSATRRGQGTESHEWGDAEWDAYFADLRATWGTRAGEIRRLRRLSPSALEAPEDVDDHIAMLRLSASPSSAIAMLQVHRRSDVTDILPAIRVPTLVLHRTGDTSEDVAAGRDVAQRIPGARFLELDGVDALPWYGDSSTIVEAIEAHIDGESPDDPDRILATVLFTDIVDSTATAAALGDERWARLLADHDAQARSAVARHRGRFVESRGDGLMAVFDGPARAVRCAQTITAAASALGLGVRAGCHTGEIEVGSGQAQGIAVHVGARIAALGGASEVLVSSTVHDLTAGSGLRFELAGEHELKGVPERWRVFRVTDTD